MITLIPCNNEVESEWTEGLKYALVGKTSEETHMIFVVSSYWQATEVRDSFTKIMKDSDYEIMEVKE